MKYYIIAGEASGDLHASNLMKELKVKDENAKFHFWGGDLMAKQGGEQVKHYKDTAYMGFVDVLKNLRGVFKNLKLCKKDIADYKPDVVILIDYAGFNLKIAEFAHNKGFKVYYYISPKVWAWKQSRVFKIKKYVDKLFAIFPFEIDFYKKYDYEINFVGNPLLDAVEKEINNKLSPEDFRKEHKLSEKPIIAILAGSRKLEIKNNLPLMLDIIKHFPDYQFVMAAAPSLDLEIYDKYIKNYDLKIVYNKTYEVLQQSEAALVTSGTATLEAALLNIPEIVCYRGDYISAQIIKLLIKVDYISLVNLIMNKEIIKEFVQDEMTISNIVEELKRLLFDKDYRSSMLNNYSEMRKSLGGKGASERTASIIYKSLSAC